MFSRHSHRLDTLRRVSLVLVILAAPVIARGQETTDTTKLAAPLRAARAAMNAAYIALDTRAAGRHFGDSAVVEFQGQLHSGRAAVDAWLANSLQGVSAIRFGPSTFMISENEVMDHSSYTVVLPDGTEQGGRANVTWRRQADGSWKVVRLAVT